MRPETKALAITTGKEILFWKKKGGRYHRSVRLPVVTANSPSNLEANSVQKSAPLDIKHS